MSDAWLLHADWTESALPIHPRHPMPIHLEADLVLLRHLSWSLAACYLGCRGLRPGDLICFVEDMDALRARLGIFGRNTTCGHYFPELSFFFRAFALIASSCSGKQHLCHLGISAAGELDSHLVFQCSSSQSRLVYFFGDLVQLVRLCVKSLCYRGH